METCISNFIHLMCVCNDYNLNNDNDIKISEKFISDNKTTSNTNFATVTNECINNNINNYINNNIKNNKINNYINNNIKNNNINNYINNNIKNNNINNNIYKPGKNYCHINAPQLPLFIPHNNASKTHKFITSSNRKYFCRHNHYYIDCYYYYYDYDCCRHGFYYCYSYSDKCSSSCSVYCFNNHRLRVVVVVAAIDDMNCDDDFNSGLINSGYINSGYINSNIFCNQCYNKDNIFKAVFKCNKYGLETNMQEQIYLYYYHHQQHQQQKCPY
ncbi:hypothetical protein HELRODRAFT_170636 [Helobdella robusta]|uniref:Uncharacterized protein n=1 Tax=Helobdella robusta TaxID=6412 RepID=T1F397_HELRO|nr:hypothetical protein HELRODRAFT_170636 [Helobdella robusta]ESO07307.1 hypothetical protein HELRODRAFT_170636 [Helobdella robusta]